MHARHVIVLVVIVVALVLRVGYGVARYGPVLGVSGAEFVALWNYDALEHVLIAQAIRAGKGYIVDPTANLEGKTVRSPGREALFKAPLYEYLLAGLFAVGGLSFWLFFPLQAAAGAALSGLMALVTMDVFENRVAALYAGLAAAGHPVLVNAASQPYNENVYFFLFALTLWTFLRWLRNGSRGVAIACGVLAALTALTRESMVPVFAAMIGFGLITSWRTHRKSAVAGSLVMVAVAALTIAPWTLRNYLRFGLVVPISSISGTLIAAGNNECVAAQPLSTAFYGDDGCKSLDMRRYALLKESPGEPYAVWNDRVDAKLGLDYIREHPVEYVRLCVRRAWTALLPYHPRQELGLFKKTIPAGYLLLVVVPGLVGAIACAVSRPSREVQLLLLLIVVSYAPLVAIFVSHDLRFRIGFDLLLACFAGWAVAHWMPPRRSPIAAPASS